MGIKLQLKDLQISATHDAAKSYALFYQDICKNQYKFRVICMQENNGLIVRLY
jgi:hypothetical protein